MTIPIQNVYYLLLYAWNHVEEGEVVDVASEGITRMQDLLGYVLANAVSRLLTHGLDRDYITREATVAGVRGKLDLAATIKRNLIGQARTHCRFDEFEYDVPQNRIIKATLRNLLRLDDLDEGVRARVRRIHRRLDAVSEIELSRRHFRTVRVHRNNRTYDFILKLCLVIFDSLIVHPETGHAKFYDFRQDEARMGELFERFVYNFFDREQSRWRVSRPHIPWFQAQGSEHDLGYLPEMRTDVVLESGPRSIILDTKFYSDPLKGRFDQKKVISGHLYQVFSYVENRSAALPQRVHEGMLLYPVVAERFRFEYRLKGHRIRVCSIDLDQPWQAIHSDLLDLLY